MRILDRYLLGIFLSAFFIFLLAFLSLFLVVDFSTRLPRFLSLKGVETVSFMFQYYLLRLPLFLLYVLPTVTLFASMFAMVRLQKTNELVPIVTSGVSLRRLSIPFVITSVATAAGAFLLDEFALPPLMSAIGETDEILISSSTSANAIAYDLRRVYLHAREYDHVRKSMTDVTLTRSRTNGRKQQVVRADEGRWDKERKRWIFSRGTIEYYGEDGSLERIEEPGKPPRIRRDLFGVEGWTLEDSDIVPEDLQKRLSISGNFAPLSELIQKARDYPHVPSFQTAIHGKFSLPLSCVVLLLLGLPFVATPQAKSFIRGLTSCFLVTAGYYVLHIFLVDRGNAGSLDPVVASWGATVICGLGGTVAYLRMKS